MRWSRSIHRFFKYSCEKSVPHRADLCLLRFTIAKYLGCDKLRWGKRASSPVVCRGRCVNARVEQGGSRKSLWVVRRTLWSKVTSVIRLEVSGVILGVGRWWPMVFIRLVLSWVIKYLEGHNRVAFLDTCVSQQTPTPCGILLNFRVTVLCSYICGITNKFSHLSIQKYGCRSNLITLKWKNVQCGKKIKEMIFFGEWSEWVVCPHLRAKEYTVIQCSYC